MAEEKEVVIKISAKDLTRGEFEKVRKEIAGIDSSAQAASKAGRAFGATFVEVAKMTAIGIGSAVGAVGAMALAVEKLAAHGSEVADLRDQFDLLNRAIGLDSRKALETLDKAMDGTVPRVELMRSVNQALSQGLKVTIGDYETMGEAARVLADRVGGDQKQAFDTMIQAMATGQDRMLRTIGLDIDAEQAVRQYAASLHKTSNELTEAQQKQAIANAILEEGKRIVQESGRAQLDFADAIAQATTWIKNFRDDLAVALAESPVLNQLVRSLGDVIRSVFGRDTQGFISTFVSLVEKAAFTLVEFGRTGVSIAGALGHVFYGLRTVFNGVFTALLFVQEQFTKGLASVLEFGAQIPGVGKHVQTLAWAARDSANFLEGMRKGLASATAEAWNGVKGQGAYFDTLKNVDKALAETTQKMIAAAAQTRDAAEAHNTAAAAVGRQATATGGLSKEIEALIKKTRDFVEIEPQIVDWHGNIVKMTKEMAQQKLAAIEMIKEAETEAARLSAERNKTQFEFTMAQLEKEKAAKIAALRAVEMATEENLAIINRLMNEKMQEAAAIHNAAVKKMESELNTWGKLAKKWIEAIPNLLKAAFTGGGGFAGGLKALFTDIGSDVFGKLFSAGGLFGKLIGGSGLGKSISGMLTKAFGTSLGAILPGIGSAIGALTGPLISKIGGFFKRLFGGGEKKEVQKQLNAFFAAFEGGLEGLKKKAAEAGISLDRLLHAKKVKDFQAAMKDVLVQLAEWQAKQARIQELIDKYGFTIDQLGPKWKAQKQEEAVRALREEYQLLIEAGIDRDLVLQKLAQSENFLTAESNKRMEELKAQLDELEDRRERLHESIAQQTPEAITDAIRAAQQAELAALDKQIEEHRQKIDEEAKRAARALEEALGLVKVDPVRVPIEWNIPPFPGFSDEGREMEIPAADAGGLFSHPTVRVIAERRPEVVGSPDAIVSAMAEAMKKVKVGGGADPELRRTLAALGEQIGHLRGDLMSLGPDIQRSVRDGVLLATG